MFQVNFAKDSGESFTKEGSTKVAGESFTKEGSTKVAGESFTKKVLPELQVKVSLEVQVKVS
jgi:hypothetical protein